MNLKTKNTVIIVATLLTGMIIGFFISGQLTRHRIKKMRHRIENPEAREQHLMNKLDLTAEKEEQVRGILDWHFNETQPIHREFKREMHTKRKELRDTLSTVLTPQEMKKMRRALRFDHPKKHRRRNRK
jgi:uncharacterized protein YneF (UPF0154 family)